MKHSTASISALSSCYVFEVIATGNRISIHIQGYTCYQICHTHNGMDIRHMSREECASQLNWHRQNIMLKRRWSQSAPSVRFLCKLR